MADPLFWLGLSLLLVAVSLTAVLIVAIPTLRELSRAARSAEKLFDTLGRELPPTLEAIRLTGLEVTELTDDVSESVQHAGRVVRQVDEGLVSARRQAQSVQTGTRSFLAGAKAAWRAWSQSPQPKSRKRPRFKVNPPERSSVSRPQETSRTSPHSPDSAKAAAPVSPPSPGEQSQAIRPKPSLPNTSRLSLPHPETGTADQPVSHAHVEAPPSGALHGSSDLAPPKAAAETPQIESESAKPFEP